MCFFFLFTLWTLIMAQHQRGKQGKSKRPKNEIVTGELPKNGEDIDFIIDVGVAPVTLLEPTMENLAALERELLEAEESLAHYRAKVKALQKLISTMGPKIRFY